ncbi:MAG: PLP-dependent aminotransferase family protein [bacterium]
MTIKLARRMQEMQASEIREILKVTQEPDVFSFAGGLPAPELFPVTELRQAAMDVLGDEGWRALQYSTTEGFPELRHWIVERMNRRRGMDVRPVDCSDITVDEILITSGSQQGLDLVGKLLLDEGDQVLCESPTYLGAISAFKVFRPQFVEVPTDDDGMLTDELERRLVQGRRVKCIYTIPDFQNPSGRAWSLQRRREFMELAIYYNVSVIEDSPYAELRFDGESLPSLKSLDGENLVIFLGTFSKILCPGLRLAWLAADPELVKKCVLIKQGTDLHTSSFTQLQVLALLERYDLEAALERIRDVYRERRDLMLQTMDRTFPPSVRYTRPEGGMFLWVELPAGGDARDLLIRCLAQKIAFVPGGSFFPNGGRENCFRLNFSNLQPERIEEGIERLAGIVTRYLDETGVALQQAG